MEGGQLAASQFPAARTDVAARPHSVDLTHRSVRDIGFGSSDLAVTSDAELLDRCRDGDRAAWEALVGRYDRLVYSVARRNGLSAEDAGDVCQSTFVALLEGIDSLRESDRLASWLMTVARRTSWRVNGRERREHPVAEFPDRAAPDSPDWSELAAVHEALARVGQPCRDLLIALYFDPTEPSYAAVAARFGRSVGGIGPLRGRCLQRMRTLLDAS